MKKVRVKELRGEEWKIEGDLVLKEGKIYVPKDVDEPRIGTVLEVLCRS